MNIKRSSFRHSHSRFRFLNPLSSLIILVISLASCEDSASFLGIDLLPGHDRLHTSTSDTNTVVAYIGSIDTMPAFNLQTGLLGSSFDPVFGMTDAALGIQFSTASRRNRGTNPIADSVFLVLRYDTLYGNPATSLSIRTYLLKDTFSVNKPYFTNQDMDGKIAAEAFDKLPFFTSEGDSLLKISLDTKLIGDLILSADSINQDTNPFHSIFKGLYVTADPVSVSGEGSILKVNFNSAYSRLYVYYHNDEEDSLAMLLYSGPKDAAFNTIKRDYSSTSFVSQLNDSTQPVTKGFVQGGNGLFTRLTFPYFSAWKDSFPAAINQVQLIVPVEEDNKAYYPPAAALYIKARSDTGTFTVLPDEYYFSYASGGSAYLGGSYDSEKKSYTFNVTELMQQYLLGDVKNNDVYLRLVNTVQNPSTERIIILNTVDDPIRLKVTYSKQ